jgi:hypothetical protein
MAFSLRWLSKVSVDATVNEFSILVAVATDIVLQYVGADVGFCSVWYNAGCNRIRYKTLKICDQTNSNIAKQFITEHFLTLQDFL